MYSTSEKRELNDKTQKATNDLHDGVRRVKEDVREAVGNVKSDLEDMAREAGFQAREFVGSAEKSVVTAGGSVTERIYDNPVQSSVIALGLGVVLGLLLFRGR